MLRTKEEIKDIAKAILNGLVADLLEEFANVNHAWSRAANKRRMNFLKNHEELVEEILLSKFGSSD